MNRRDFTAFTALVAATGYARRAAAQAAYPVKMLVGFPPGTATDVATRAIAESMARRLGAPFIVENRSGASSNIAAKAVAAASPDGLMVFMATA